MREIVTLQFGQQANYVGTHFWNAQESYFTYGDESESPVDHDIHFRPGIGADGTETYTPRTVIYDLKGAFGTLKRDNALYEVQEDNPHDQALWNGSQNVLRQSQIPQSTYQQALDQGLTPPSLSTDTVRFWSDYNRAFYHPHSIVQLHEHELNSSLTPFERWDTGEELFSNLDREHDLLDRDLRPFLEECDAFQGVQLIASVDDAWGGFTARYLERIRDELGKSSAWVWGLEDGSRKPREKLMQQTANLAQSLFQIVPQASMYLPLTSVPATLPAYVQLDSSSRWHTSAMQVTALETATLSSRLRAGQVGRTSFNEIEAALTNDGNRRVAKLEFSVDDPAKLAAEEDGGDHHDPRMNGQTNGFTANGDGDAPPRCISMQPPAANLDGRRMPPRRTHLFSQTESLRGKWKSSIEIEDMNLASRDRFADGPRTQISQSQLLFPLLDSFPQIYQLDTNPSKLAIQASISTDTSVADRIRSVERAVRTLVGVEEREALCDGLISMCQEYEEGPWSSGSDDDEDED